MLKVKQKNKYQRKRMGVQGNENLSGLGDCDRPGPNRYKLYRSISISEVLKAIGYEPRWSKNIA